MLKRLVALVMCVLLPMTALAEGWMTGTDQDDATENVTTDTVYEAADGVGDVVNTGAPAEPTEQERITYSFTPLEVVLVLDSSGSMEARNPRNNKSILSYAQDAAVAFCQTLFAINPASRVAVVGYDSSAYKVADFAGAVSSNQLQAAIRSIDLGDMTDIGGGMRMAVDMLGASALPGRHRVVLLLTDGYPNVGNDPVRYAVDQGWRAAEEGLVYTVGLVGGVDASSMPRVHQTLNAGYETRYFEVDFTQVSDITSELASAFMTIAMSGSMQDADEDSCFYRLHLTGELDMYIENSAGEYLSSAAWDFCDSASFGSFYTLGDNMDEKMVVLYDDDYRITLHGRTTGSGAYELTEVRGIQATEHILLAEAVQTHPAMYETILLVDGSVTTVDESYEPLDIYARAPFTGDQSRGLEIPAVGIAAGEATVRAYPASRGEKICKIAKNTSVSVLALDADTGFYLIAFPDRDGWAVRGWVPRQSVRTEGYVPDMIWLDEAAIMGDSAAARRIPLEIAPEVSVLRDGQRIVIRHAERDSEGSEWLYVQPEGKEALYYVPAAAVDGWTPQTALDFRIGYAAATLLWSKTIGAGYTEVMWAIPQKDGDGVLLSGRTTSGKAPFRSNKGERDAFVIALDSAGAAENAVTAGGSAVDSYHCIIPAPEGYYVSGITRSNDKDFRNTWDANSTTGSTGTKAGRSNALIGHLNEDLSIDWLKSFGSGDTSYGFDVVVELADGNIAGAGWMTTSRKATIAGNGMQDFYVVKLTPDGEVLAEACFGGSNDDVPDSAVATPDGGLIIIGCTKSYGGRDGWILVLDKELRAVREYRYGGSGEDVFDNIRAIPDGTYLVTGFTDSPDGNGGGMPHGGRDFWAMNIDAEGRTIWVKRYGGSKDEELCGTIVMADGRCLLLGSTSSNDGDVMGATGKNKDAWAVCIDDTGRIVWQYASGMSGDDAFNTAAIDPADGCCVLAGLCNESGSKAKALVVKVQK